MSLIYGKITFLFFQKKSDFKKWFFTKQEQRKIKLEKINDHLGNIDVTLAKQELSLQEHIRRTNLNEQAIERTAYSRLSSGGQKSEEAITVDIIKKRQRGELKSAVTFSPTPSEIAS